MNGGVVKPKMVSCTANNWVLTLSVMDEEFALELKRELINAAGKGNGKTYALALVELDDNEHIVNEAVALAPVAQNPEPKPFGKAARLLRYDTDPEQRFLATIQNPNFCSLFGSDEKYQAWCRKQPCAKTGDLGWEQNAVVYAHVRRQGKPETSSGTGFKADYMGIPLINSLHLEQHHKGEITLFGSKDWMANQRDDHVSKWIASHFGCESLGYVDPVLMVQYCERKNAAHLLPAKYRELAK